MAKTKRKHLAALGTKKNQSLLAHHEVKSEPMMKETGHPLSPESLAQVSSTSPSFRQQKRPVKVEGEGNVASHPSASPPETEQKSKQNEAPVSPSSPHLPQPHVDDSDTNSWVDVRKQRVIIIIPPLPPAKPRFLKNRAKLHEGKLKGKCSNMSVYGKSRRQDAMENLETENHLERSISRRMRESVCTGAPRISSMDILLASALGTDHTICTPWEEKKRQHAATCSAEEASLDTADSSVQPMRLSLKERRRLGVPLGNSSVAQGHIKRRKISLSKSAHPSVTRKRKKPQQGASLANDALGHLLNPDIRDAKANGPKHSSEDAPILGSNQAIKISMLRKHLEKAGGLRSWLCSLGLGEFKEVFEKRTWSERDLLQLQMDDLKRMGKSAVGPRRKLIWAIHHLSYQLV